MHHKYWKNFGSTYAFFSKCLHVFPVQNNVATLHTIDISFTFIFELFSSLLCVNTASGSTQFSWKVPNFFSSGFWLQMSQSRLLVCVKECRFYLLLTESSFHNCLTFLPFFLKGLMIWNFGCFFWQSKKIAQVIKHCPKAENPTIPFFFSSPSCYYESFNCKLQTHRHFLGFRRLSEIAYLIF